MEEAVQCIIESLPPDIENNIENRLNGKDIINLAESFQCCILYPWNVFAQKHLKLNLGQTENIFHDCPKRFQKVSHYQKQCDYELVVYIAIVINDWKLFFNLLILLLFYYLSYFYLRCDRDIFKFFNHHNFL